MSDQHNDHNVSETGETKRRTRGLWRGVRRRNRSRGALAGSPPGAGGRLIDLRGPRLY